jgi:hypothetical protein
MATLRSAVSSSGPASASFFTAGILDDPELYMLLHGVLPTAVGQIVTRYKGIVITHRLSGDRHLEFASIDDIVTPTSATTRGYRVNTVLARAEDVEGYKFNGGTAIETLTCTDDASFSAASVSAHCKILKTDSIGVVASLVRSLGGFDRRYKNGCHPIGGAGDVVSVDVVFLRARNGAVEIVGPQNACCNIM